MSILKKGEASRSYAGTAMNDESSRSHVIYRVSIEAQVRDDVNFDASDPTAGDSVGSTRLSYLNLVDLAGPFPLFI